MAEFKREEIDQFLATVRKYMQLRGAMTQKDLAEKSDIGISTLSRFLAQKTTELNPMIITKIVAILDIPLGEVVDFVDEEFFPRFTRLVKYYKSEFSTVESDEKIFEPSLPNVVQNEVLNTPQDLLRNKAPISIKDKFDELTPKQKIFITEFLELKLEEKDVIVDVGNNLLQYFKLKGMNI